MKNNGYFGEDTRSDDEKEDEVGILGIQFRYVISLQMRKKIYKWKGKINVVRY